jgi:hypothetical protein
MKQKTIILALYITCMLIILINPVYAQLNEIAVTGIRLDKKSLQLPIGYQETIKATVYPADATNKNLFWVSEDSAIVKIEPAGRTVKITAMAPGNVRVTAVTSDGNFRAHCQVEVFIAVKNIKLDQEELSLLPGDKIQLNVSIFPEDAHYQEVTWESTNAVTAVVNIDGLVEALQPGEGRIIARSVQDKGITAYCNLVVNELPLTEEVTGEKDDGEIEQPENISLFVITDYFSNGNSIYIFAGAIILLLILLLTVLIKRNKKKKVSTTPSQSGAMETNADYNGTSNGPVTVKASISGAAAALDTDTTDSSAVNLPRLIGTKGEYAGQTIELGEEELFIGRDHRIAQLIYPVDREIISRRHCSISYSKEDDQFVLVDYSASGTYLGNGERLEPGEEYYLQSGDSFYLADPAEEYTVK